MKRTKNVKSREQKRKNCGSWNFLNQNIGSFKDSVTRVCFEFSVRCNFLHCLGPFCFNFQLSLDHSIFVSLFHLTFLWLVWGLLIECVCLFVVIFFIFFCFFCSFPFSLSFSPFRLSFFLFSHFS